MFAMVEERKVWWPVKWEAPIDNGKSEPVSVDFQFVMISDDDSAEIIQAAMKLDDEGDDAKPLSERKAELVMRFAADWKGIGNEDKEAVDFSQNALARFFRMPGTFMPVINAFARCRSGVPEARRKN